MNMECNVCNCFATLLSRRGLFVCERVNCRPAPLRTAAGPEFSIMYTYFAQQGVAADSTCPSWHMKIQGQKPGLAKVQGQKPSLEGGKWWSGVPPDHSINARSL